MNESPLLAKRVEVDGRVRFQTLEGHTRDVMHLLDVLLNAPELELFCHRWKLDLQVVRCALMLTAILHDVGKATKAFQQAIREGRHLSDIPHALVALPVAYELWKRSNFPRLCDHPLPFIELLVIVSHHSLLYDGLYQTAIRGHAHLDFLGEAAERFLQGLFSWAAERLDEPSLREVPPLPFEEWNRWELRRLAEALQRLREFSEEFKGDNQAIVRLKALYSFALSKLKLADQWASRHFAEVAPTLKEEILEALEPSLPPWFWPEDAEAKVRDLLSPPHPFQEELAQTEASRVVLMAPCGRGKTEGALLWTLNQRRRGHCERLILAMPTQVTSNAMRERLAELFGEEAVGLYHGRSSLEHRELLKLKLEAKTDGEDLHPEVERELVRSENFWGEVFAKPITITTVDHLLYTFVHGFRQADFALGNLQTAAIIFDEVHYYDRRMLAELRELFRLLRLMGIPHLLMSGTLPEFLIREAQLDGYTRITDEEGLGFRPFVLRRRDTPLLLKEEGQPQRATSWQPHPQEVEGVLEGHERGLVQFVIVNTVRKAQAFYQALRERLGAEAAEHLFCLHSRFCYAHRRERERLVLSLLREGKHPLILVATQVIEVSLDISCDRMFTELAPMDALGQRAGRLHRGASQPEEYELLVFTVDDPRPYCVPPKQEPLPELDRTWEALQDEIPISYEWLRERCNEVYTDATLDMAQLDRLFEACTLFGPNYDEVRFSEEEGKIYRPRDIVMPTIDVIPQTVLEELGDEGCDPLYLAPVPTWWVGRSNREKLSLFSLHEVNHRSWLICHVPYSPELGFEEEELGVPPSEAWIE